MKMWGDVVGLESETPLLDVTTLMGFTSSRGTGNDGKLGSQFATE